MRRLVGDANVAAIFVKDHIATKEQEVQVDELEVQDVTEMLRYEMAPSEKLIEHVFCTWPFDQPPVYLRSLKAFATAANIYKLLPTATVELKTIGRTIGTQLWVPPILGWESAGDDFKRSTMQGNRAFEAFEPNRAQTLACLAMFETGTMDIRPRVLNNVMAMATGNSIYVPSSLVCDPYEKPQPHEVARVIGNIGRPGVAMLFSPENLRIREPSINNWRVNNHKEFDGKSRDNFTSTSLHLSFTGYDLPIGDVTIRGAQDIEASLVESVVSVHEHGKWVADIDIIGALQSHMLSRLAFATRCSHERTVVSSIPVIAIDNWDEYLERPDKVCVFRGRNNSLARLAATAISIQNGIGTIVGKDSICAGCCIALSTVEKPFPYPNFIL
jgi:hypothetical protein